VSVPRNATCPIASRKFESSLSLVIYNCVNGADYSFANPLRSY
jgi:hypothetical protein